MSGCRSDVTGQSRHLLGAAPSTAGVLKGSPGNYAGHDNGWAMALVGPVINNFVESMRKYPNIPTIPGGGSIGSDLPEFMPPNLMPAPNVSGSSASRIKQ
jgi:hypothetical protein